MTTTAKDWRALPAGRELNALVAERVLGAMIHEGQHDDYMTLPGERPISDQRPVPHYSTDIAAAWPVVESMEARGFRLDLRTPFMPGEPHFAGFTPHGVTGWNGRPDHEQHADTPALAIARAALAATEAR